MSSDSKDLPEDLRKAYDVLDMTRDSGYTWLDMRVQPVTWLYGKELLEQIAFAKSEVQEVIDALNVIESYIPKT